MSNGKTLYHLVFAELLKERAPPGIRVIPELTLSTEPQRADFLLLRQEGIRRDAEARTLRRLWPMLPSDTLVEYKSPTRPVRRGDVARLLGYGAQYFSMEVERLQDAHNLALVLVVASPTPTLERELEAFRWTRTDLNGGYYRLDSDPFSVLLVVVDEVSRSEKDELLDLVGHRALESDSSRAWLDEHRPPERKENGMLDVTWEEAKKMEGFQELYGPILIRKAMQRWPREMLGQLTPGEQLLALDTDLLRQLPDDLIDRQPLDIREKIRARLAESAESKP